eukprot:9134120-Pyramimonas_sp.AAC.1
MGAICKAESRTSRPLGRLRDQFGRTPRHSAASASECSREARASQTWPWCASARVANIGRRIRLNDHVVDILVAISSRVIVWKCCRNFSPGCVGSNF